MGHFSTEIIEKAKKRNKELGYIYYSEDPGEYEYINTIYYGGYQIIFYNCQRSKSTITVMYRQETSNKSEWIPANIT